VGRRTAAALNIAKTWALLIGAAAAFGGLGDEDRDDEA